MIILQILVLFISISFFFYGLGCFYSPTMYEEFHRFGLTSFQRQLTGFFQVAGALGLAAGYYFLPILGFSAAIGLTLLMSLGFGVRIKIKDNFIQSFPSLFFALLNLFVAFRFYQFFDLF
ncbi:DoxX family protein [Psychroflexus montanilacus]|uniref:DoxX family protein n=1 Tax=Psychroflexus montanilacus TaxID=2873598 RepID=UPI001CCD93C1|nr:DoxX family protein [Psychroflexus montanilacus]MBZ9651163.1 DoxX family protein [Psychroflexus montanilacus]